MGNITDTLYSSINEGLFQAASFIPSLVAGLLILLAGIILSSLARTLTVGILRSFKVSDYLKKYDIPEGKNQISWEKILSEIVRWFVLIIFLVPTADTWGLPQVTNVLTSILLYLPNVFVAVIIVLVGFVFARIAHDVVLVSTKQFSKNASNITATLARWAIVVFSTLAALHQLGIATDLIKILFGGFVFMLSLAGGLAFGLGGKGFAQDIIESFRKTLKR